MAALDRLRLILPRGRPFPPLNQGLARFPRLRVRTFDNLTFDNLTFDNTDI